MRRCVSFFAILTYGAAAFAATGISDPTTQPKTIVADKIEYDVKSETVHTTGKTEITNQSGQRMTLTDSYITRGGENLAADDIQIWLGQHVYVETDDLTRDGDLTIARDAMFTACDGCDDYGNAWEVSATKITHNMETHRISFFNPVLWVLDVPVLWAPYFTMSDPSVKYKTGFLMPDFESTNNMGTQINIPFYVSISDTHDLTLTLSYLTQENPMFQAEHRLNMDHSQYRTRGAYTRNRAGEDRWFIYNNDVIEMGEYARATVFLERASDRTFLQKYGFYADQPYLDSGARVEMFGQSSYVVADAHVFQELRTAYGRQMAPAGDILPNIRGVYQTAPMFYETYATFGADILGISGDAYSSQRVIGDARITSPWTLWGGNRLTLSLDARYDVYNFDNTQMVDGTMFSGVKNRFLPSGYVEWGLPLFRAGATWTQIIEPRARMTVMRNTDRDQFALNNDSAGALLSDATLFSDNRFAGLDLWENGQFADYGAQYTIFNETGFTASAFVGQSFDFTDRADTDPNSGFHAGASDFVGRVSASNSKWLDVSSRFRLARENLALRHMETSAVIGTPGTYLNLGHIWSQQFVDAVTRTNSINEALIGAGIRFSDRWSVRWNAIYNPTYKTFLRHSGGIFYNHPCYYLSVEYRRDNAIKEDYVGTTTFQFRFGMSIDGRQLGN